MINQSGRDYFDYRIQQMTSEASSWKAQWQELNNAFQPRRGKFNVGDRNKGNKRNQLPNNTPLFAKRTLRSGMMTGITSPARPWFKLAPPDEEMSEYGPVRQWLDDVQTVTYSIFARSGLYRVLPNIYEEVGVIGTSCMMQEESFNHITKFTPFTVGEYMLDVDGDRKVDTFAREYQMTVYQIVDKFGIDKCSTHVKSLWESRHYSAWIDVRHLIEKNNRKFEGINVSSDFEYRSIYYEISREKVEAYLSIKGYHEFPIHAPRWDTKPGDIYGIGPGMDAIGDALALQVQERESGKAVAKMVSPPTIAPSALKNIQVSLLPGANNFSDDPNNVFRAIYQIDPRVQELEMKMRTTEDRINRAFYVDLFLMLSNDMRNQRATATEVAQKHEEKLLQLGPVLENLNHELLDPLIQRTFQMMVRASKPGWNGVTDFMVIPPPPKELMDPEGKPELKVEYVSILAQAQKMVSTGATERWVGFVGQMAAIPGLESVIDKVNADEIADNMAEDLGVPNKAVHTSDEVEEKRAERQKAQAAQQQQEQMTQMTDAAHKMSQTDTTGNNVLTDVLGIGQ
jgi:hypothetical protein